MKDVRIIPATQSGEKIFHVWGENVPSNYHVFTQRNAGVELAFSSLQKEFGKCYMSITYCSYKKDIIRYFC